MARRKKPPRTEVQSQIPPEISPEERQVLVDVFGHDMDLTFSEDGQSVEIVFKGLPRDIVDRFNESIKKITGASLLNMKNEPLRTILSIDGFEKLRVLARPLREHPLLVDLSSEKKFEQKLKALKTTQPEAYLQLLMIKAQMRVVKGVRGVRGGDNKFNKIYAGAFSPDAKNNADRIKFLDERKGSAWIVVKDVLLRQGIQFDQSTLKTIEELSPFQLWEVYSGEKSTSHKINWNDPLRALAGMYLQMIYLAGIEYRDKKRRETLKERAERSFEDILKDTLGLQNTAKSKMTYYFSHSQKDAHLLEAYKMSSKADELSDNDIVTHLDVSPLDLPKLKGVSVNIHEGSPGGEVLNQDEKTMHRIFKMVRGDRGNSTTSSEQNTISLFEDGFDQCASFEEALKKEAALVERFWEHLSISFGRNTAGILPTRIRASYHNGKYHGDRLAGGKLRILRVDLVYAGLNYVLNIQGPLAFAESKIGIETSHASHRERVHQEASALICRPLQQIPHKQDNHNVEEPFIDALIGETTEKVKEIIQKKIKSRTPAAPSRKETTAHAVLPGGERGFFPQGRENSIFDFIGMMNDQKKLERALKVMKRRDRELYLLAKMYIGIINGLWGGKSADVDEWMRLRANINTYTHIVSGLNAQKTENVEKYLSKMLGIDFDRRDQRILLNNALDALTAFAKTLGISKRQFPTNLSQANLSDLLYHILSIENMPKGAIPHESNQFEGLQILWVAIVLSRFRYLEEVQSEVTFQSDDKSRSKIRDRILRAMFGETLSEARYYQTRYLKEQKTSTGEVYRVVDIEKDEIFRKWSELALKNNRTEDEEKEYISLQAKIESWSKDGAIYTEEVIYRRYKGQPVVIFDKTSKRDSRAVQKAVSKDHLDPFKNSGSKSFSHDTEGSQLVFEDEGNMIEWIEDFAGNLAANNLIIEVGHVDAEYMKKGGGYRGSTSESEPFHAVQLFVNGVKELMLFPSWEAYVYYRHGEKVAWENYAKKRAKKYKKRFGPPPTS